MTSGPDDRWTLPPLTLADRCDFRCNAPALLRVVMATGDLYACAHHFDANADGLRAVAAYVQDERLAPRTDTEDMEPLGRMLMRRGLTHADPCRWCCTRLDNVRTFGAIAGWRDYFLCPVCDRTAADMESLKGITE